MRQLTHIPITREAVDAIRSRPPAPTKPPSAAEDGSSWPCAPAAVVRIYEIEREWSTPMWLCPAGRAEMERQRWKIRSHRAPPFDSLQCYVHRDGPCPA
jgi:hypothetical protein